jgi:hypothetical protein
MLESIRKDFSDGKGLKFGMLGKSVGGLQVREWRYLKVIASDKETSFLG